MTRRLRHTRKRHDRRERAKKLNVAGRIAKWRDYAGNIERPDLVPEYWTAQDQACAVTQGWGLWRANTSEVYEIKLFSSRGRKMFETGLRKRRRLNVKAMIAVGVHQLLGVGQ